MANVKVKVLETCGGFDERAGLHGQYFVYTAGEHEVSARRYDMIKGANVVSLLVKTKAEKRPANLNKVEKR